MAFLENLILRVVIFLLSLLPFASRVTIGSILISFIIKVTPKLRTRILQNYDLVSEKLDISDRNKFLKLCAANLGKTFTEFLFNEEFQKQINLFHYESKELEVLKIAKRDNIPVIIVSGHFGPWEAIRAILKANELETGALYRRSRNKFYEPYHLKTIQSGGLPVLQAGKKGTKKMLRHIKTGGFIAFSNCSDVL